MTEIDTQKDFFLFLHGKMDLKQKATDVLIAKGCSESKITMGAPKKSWQCRRLHGSIMATRTSTKSNQNSTNN